MNGERGQAFILVLILLAVGALLIVPTLQYASTGLTAYRVSEELMTEQYAADAAVEDAMWRLKYNEVFPGTAINRDLLVPLDQGGPDSVSYSLIVNGIPVDVTVALPSPPDTVTTKQGRVAFKLDRSAGWMKMGDTVTYTLTITNRHPKKELYITQVGAVLPPGFSYVPGSSNDSDIAPRDPDNTIYADGGDELSWTVSYSIPPDDKTTPEKENEKVQIFAATGVNVDGGIYYTVGRVSYQPRADSAGEVGWFDTDEDAPVWVSMYHITATAGRVTITASVGLTKDYDGDGFPDVNVYSWQEE